MRLPSLAVTVAALVLLMGGVLLYVLLFPASNMHSSSVTRVRLGMLVVVDRSAFTRSFNMQPMEAAELHSRVLRRINDALSLRDVYLQSDGLKIWKDYPLTTTEAPVQAGRDLGEYLQRLLAERKQPLERLKRRTHLLQVWTGNPYGGYQTRVEQVTASEVCSSNGSSRGISLLTISGSGGKLEPESEIADRVLHTLLASLQLWCSSGLFSLANPDPWDKCRLDTFGPRLLMDQHSCPPALADARGKSSLDEEEEGEDEESKGENATWIERPVCGNGMREVGEECDCFRTRDDGCQRLCSNCWRKIPCKESRGDVRVLAVAGLSVACFAVATTIFCYSFPSRSRDQRRRQWRGRRPETATGSTHDSQTDTSTDLESVTPTETTSKTTATRGGGSEQRGTGGETTRMR